ncbi:MAG: hypothetical protein ACERJ1_18005 [Halodesulfovibrio sp.]|uniref:hypothetical protein n=1 Tax=Halodesulfovibrio sp. TaxID=1912772 RepID=UPI00359D7529
MKKKMGRPTDNPKTHRVTIRIDDECKGILDSYGEKYKVTIVDSVRAAIKKLQTDLDNGEQK